MKLFYLHTPTQYDVKKKNFALNVTFHTELLQKNKMENVHVTKIPKLSILGIVIFLMEWIELCYCAKSGER